MITGQLSNDILTLLKQRIGQSFVEFLSGGINNVNLERTSLTAATNGTVLPIPYVATNDIPREIIIEQAKAVEIKIAWDIKRYLETIMHSNPQDVSFKKLMKNLPITVIQKTPIQASGDIKKNFFKMLDEGGIKLEAGPDGFLEETYYKASVDITVEDMVRNKMKMFSEAPSSVVVKNRNYEMTNIKVEVKYINKNNDIKTVEYWIGVNVNPRIVDKDELIKRVAQYDNRRFYQQFVKLERNEISFVKDFIFDIKLLKFRAKSRSQGLKNILNVVDNFKLLSDAGISVYPFLVLGVSKDFEKELLSLENIELKNDIFKILKKFCAMGIMIYDQSSDLVDILYDGESDFSTYTRDDVAKESSKYERELQNIIKYNRN